MYIKFTPNDYVIRYRSGKVVSEGRGLSFYFLERNTSVVSVPVSNNDADFIFEEVTGDFQTITVQGQLTYKIVDFKKISASLDFSVNLKSKLYVNNPIEKLSKRIINIAKVLVKSKVGTTALTDAIQSSQKLASDVYKELGASTELADLGVQICGFSILKIAANPETTRALEAKTREAILKQADDALYERRNASIDQERKVKENELNTELTIAQKKKTIKESEFATRKMVAEKEAELERLSAENESATQKMRVEKENEINKIKAESQNELLRTKAVEENNINKLRAESQNELLRIKAMEENEINKKRVENQNDIKRIQVENDAMLEEKLREIANVRLENKKKEAEAEAYRIAAIVDAYTKLSPEVLVALSNMNMDPEKLIAQAFQQLAGNSQKIGQLNITPDLLESVMNNRK